MAEVVLLVNGIPGSGKTTLAGPLARRLGLPLLGRDTIKESLFDSLGARDRDWSRQLGQASAQVIWALVPHIPGPVVLDSFVGRPIRDMFLNDARSAGVGRILEIWCEISPGLAHDRYRERALTSRHPGHRDSENTQTVQGRAGQNAALEIGPLLRVPTGRPVDLELIAAWVRTTLSTEP